METEYLTARKTVCRDFQVLMRTEIEIPLPAGYSEIRGFYETMKDTILRWTTEREGERLLEEYLAADPRERARFKTEIFRVRGEVLPTGREWFAVVCSAWQAGQEAGASRVLQVWNLSEQTLLPSKEIISRFPEEKFRKFFTKSGKRRKVGKKLLQ